jgi:GNAT superfamily N-acetyltransferase
MIITIKGNSEDIVINKLAKIVLKQMEFIGSKHNFEKVTSAIRNALKNERTTFFIKTNEKSDFIGFAFGNISSGLESGSDYLWVNELYVEKEYRRKNVATEIFSFIEKWAKQNGIKYIATMTSKENNEAIKFYGKVGYELTDIKWVDKKIE